MTLFEAPHEGGLLFDPMNYQGSLGHDSEVFYSRTPFEAPYEGGPP